MRRLLSPPVLLACGRRRFATSRNVAFNRAVKRIQRDASVRRADFDVFQYVRGEVAYRVADRIGDMLKFFPVAVDLGCGLGHVSQHVFKENVGHLIQMDMSGAMVELSRQSDQVPTYRLSADEECVPLRADAADLLVSSLSLHWVNDLPGFFERCLEALVPDGAFVAAMFGGRTLHELRVSLQLAELERLGGVATHVSPFVLPQDVAGLMRRAGFDMLTLDMDQLVVHYPDVASLMYDLQGMAENGAAVGRAPHLDRDALLAASAVYREMYGRDDGALPATFEVINMIGWRPGPLMPAPARRGSATVSFKDVTDIASRPPPTASVPT